MSLYFKIFFFISGVILAQSRDERHHRGPKSDPVERIRNLPSDSVSADEQAKRSKVTKEELEFRTLYLSNPTLVVTAVDRLNTYISKLKSCVLDENSAVEKQARCEIKKKLQSIAFETLRTLEKPEPNPTPVVNDVGPDAGAPEETESPVNPVIKEEDLCPDSNAICRERVVESRKFYLAAEGILELAVEQIQYELGPQNIELLERNTKASGVGLDHQALAIKHRVASEYAYKYVMEKEKLERERIREQDFIVTLKYDK